MQGNAINKKKVLRKKAIYSANRYADGSQRSYLASCDVRKSLKKKNLMDLSIKKGC